MIDAFTFGIFAAIGGVGCLVWMFVAYQKMPADNRLDQRWGVEK